MLVHQLHVFGLVSCMLLLMCPFLCSPSAETPDVYIVERLFSSSLVVVVSQSVPRRMNVYHFKKGTEICNYSYSNNILAVRLNRQVNTTQLCCSKTPANYPLYSSLSLLFKSLAYMWKFVFMCFSWQRLVVCLEESIYIHNIKDMKLMKTLLNTPSNPSGKWIEKSRIMIYILYIDLNINIRVCRLCLCVATHVFL